MKPSPLLKVLLVEDDPVAQKVLRQLLYTFYICEVDIAQNATEALDLVNHRAFEWDKNGYSLILMDIYLPDINGDALTEVIRKTEKQARSTPIIAISGVASESDKKIFQEMGVTDLLLKPVTSNSLKRILKKYIPDIETYMKQ